MGRFNPGTNGPGLPRRKFDKGDAWEETRSGLVDIPDLLVRTRQCELPDGLSPEVVKKGNRTSARAIAKTGVDRGWVIFTSLRREPAVNYTAVI